MECYYGCGKEAKYQIKNGKWCCSKSPNSCDINKEKNREGLKKNYSETGRNQKITYQKCSQEIKDKMAWSRGLTKDTNETLRIFSENLSKKYKTGVLKHWWSGKKHSIETKQKISNKARENNNGYVKTKYYTVFCPYLNTDVRVQGSYELSYAKYLNNNKILWKRKCIGLKYKLTDDDYYHTYFPDFYLIDSDEYIEIKGIWWKSEDGRVDDKRKMRQVFKYNKDKKIKILTRKILSKMNIL